MAAEIGVSPSYLNLIERNQRPLTVQVLLKLSGVYGIDVAELSGDDGAGRGRGAEGGLCRSAACRRDRLADGALRIRRGGAERRARRGAALRSLARSAGAALGPVAPDGARRRGAAGGRGAAARRNGRPPISRRRAAGFPSSRRRPRTLAARAFAARRSGSRRSGGIFAETFRRRSPHPAGACHAGRAARYDRHTLRLFISERVPLIERPFLLARQVALLGHRDLLDRLTRAAGIAEPEAARICRAALRRGWRRRSSRRPSRFADSGARAAARDIALLSQRFVLRPSRVMARLAALGAERASGLPPASDRARRFRRACWCAIPAPAFPFPRLRAVLRQAADLRRACGRTGSSPWSWIFPDGSPLSWLSR